MATISHTKATFRLKDFVFECGETLDELVLCYETWGSLNGERDNAILATHALTGTSHAASHPDAPAIGWWEFMIGPGRPFDTSRYFVICINVPGACSGSSGPSSINPSTGNPFGTSFPVVTIRDMVRAQKHVLDHLEIESLHTVSGASMGGMQAMEWAALFPETVRSIIPFAAPGRAYPQSIAYRKAQRKAIMLDPAWQEGQYYDSEPPVKGIELARIVGFITYRTEKEFAGRFGRNLAEEELLDLHGRFEIEHYLEYHGRKLATWFDANSYLYLSKAMDLHDLGHGATSWEAGVQRIKARTLMIGFNSDLLFPCYQQEEVATLLRKGGANARYCEIDSIYGHDAFLLEKDAISKVVHQFMEGG